MIAAIYTSAGFGNHYEYRTRSVSFPLPYDLTHFVVTRYFEGYSGTYSAVALNTADTEFAAAKCVSAPASIEGRDGDLVRYEVKYANVPAQLNEYLTSSAIYPGIPSVRWPLPARAALAKKVSNYYLIGTGGTYATVDAAPFYEQSDLWVATYRIGYVLGGNFAELTGTGGFLTNVMGFASGGTGASTAYIAMIAADAATQSSYSITAVPTAPSRYMGNIWKFETIYQKAK